MKIALISDIHANLEALEAVLKDCATQKVEAVHCLGDVVGYGADPGPCLELINERCRTKLLGNHEYAALGLLPTDLLNQVARSSLSWTHDQLTDRHFAIIAEFTLELIENDLHLVHSSPFEPDKWHYVLTQIEAKEAFAHAKTRLCFLGHSHLPAIFGENHDGSVRQQVGHDFLPDEECRYLINIGSVGQPRDNDPRACYVTCDTSEGDIEYHRVEYDIARARAKMAQARLPQMLIDRLEVGR